MNILLVDDDAHVLESIEKRLDWEELRIQERYTALNAAKARQILLEYPIDIVLCDIEMPRETGLDLLAWIRQENLEVQCLLLTSYADFQYAQRALILECVDYFLKPVDYNKLSEGLKRAAQKVRDSRKYEMYEKENRLKKRTSTSSQELFWSRLLSGFIPPSREEIEAEIHKHHLPYSADDYVAVCMVKPASVDIMEKVEWKNILTGIYQSWKSSEEYPLQAVLFWEKDLWILVIGGGAADRRLRPDLGELLVRRVRQANGGCNAVCGIGDWCMLDDFYGQAEDLQNLIRRRGANSSHVFCQWDVERREIAYCPPQLKQWETLLSQGEKERLKDQVRDYLRRQELECGMNRQTLKQFRLDITQLVYAFLRQHEIQAHMVFHNTENDKLYRSAVNSSLAMRAYTDYLLNQAFVYRELCEEPQSAINQLIKYINEHYQEELSREELAALVCLNPDYLSRKFKEKMKISISGYIMNCRVDKAKELLRSTRMPINAVALETGYDNFAYFARVFRSRTGMSPNEYRKENRQL